MTDQSTTERIAELERKNADLLLALRHVIERASYKSGAKVSDDVCAIAQAAIDGTPAAANAAWGEQSKVDGDEIACSSCGLTMQQSRMLASRQAGSAEQSKFPISDEEFQRIFDSSMTRHAEGVLDVRAFQRKLLVALSAPERKVMTDAELPQLPEPEFYVWMDAFCTQRMGRKAPEHLHSRPYFSKRQMREYALAALNRQGEQTAPEGWRDFLESCATFAGYQVNGNSLSRKAKELLAAAASTAQTLPLGKTDAE